MQVPLIQNPKNTIANIVILLNSGCDSMELNPAIKCLHGYLISGVHTNNIEAIWRYAKKFIKGRCTRQASDAASLQQMLMVYSWNKRAQKYPGGPAMSMLACLTKAFPLQW